LPPRFRRMEVRLPPCTRHHSHRGAGSHPLVYTFIVMAGVSVGFGLPFPPQRERGAGHQPRPDRVPILYRDCIGRIVRFMIMKKLGDVPSFFVGVTAHCAVIGDTTVRCHSVSLSHSNPSLDRVSISRRANPFLSHEPIVAD